MRERVVFNQFTLCPYLPGRVARMPLRRPEGLTLEHFDSLLAEGDRRLGGLLYRTKCPMCEACEPIRIPVAEFEPSRTQRRTLRKGDSLLTLRIGEPECDNYRVDLYNRHKFGRRLNQGEDAIDLDGYYEFLVATCCDSIELSYWSDDRLVAVAISDRGRTALNAVYCYFEPEFCDVSLGTYNVLKQIELTRSWGMTHLYLGFYIAESPHMNYKANFRPHERRIAGQWQRLG